jgi:DNA (cytosine-5)-methyltransferase 1
MKSGEPYAAAPSRLRRLTVEECAAIQTFPPSHRFSGRQSSRFCQIGNAVPPLLAYAVASRLLEELNQAPRKGPSETEPPHRPRQLILFEDDRAAPIPALGA